MTRRRGAWVNLVDQPKRGTIKPITGIRFSATENEGRGGLTVYRSGDVDQFQGTKKEGAKLAVEAGLVEQSNRGLTHVTWWVQP